MENIKKIKGRFVFYYENGIEKKIKFTKGNNELTIDNEFIEENIRRLPSKEERYKSFEIFFNCDGAALIIKPLNIGSLSIYGYEDHNSYFSSVKNYHNDISFQGYKVNYFYTISSKIIISNSTIDTLVFATDENKDYRSLISYDEISFYEKTLMLYNSEVKNFITWGSISSFNLSSSFVGTLRMGEKNNPIKIDSLSISDGAIINSVEINCVIGAFNIENGTINKFSTTLKGRINKFYSDRSVIAYSS